MKIYIAGPFFNDEQKETIGNIEDALDKKAIDYFSPRSFGILKNMTKQERGEHARKIYQKNIEEIQANDILIAVIDDYDTGTVFEIGYAAAIDKKIITYSAKDYDINIMLKGAIIAHCKNIEDIYDVLFDIAFNNNIDDVDLSDTY